MPDVLLLGVFVTHLPFFAWRWRRTGELRYGATTLTFALLVLVYALRVFAPEWRWGDTPVHAWVRGPALLSAVLSLGLLARHWMRRR